jgi:hypothetical protein
MGGTSRVSGVRAVMSDARRLVSADRLAVVDPLRVVFTSWWLALVAIWVVQQAHDGQHERHELPPLLHMLRDAALAVPFAAVAVLVASLLLAPRLRRVTAGARDGVADIDRLIWVVVVLLIFGALSIPGHELHGALFGVEVSDVGWFAHAVLDASITAIGGFIAVFPIALVAGPPVLRPGDQATPLRPVPAQIARSTR